MGLHTVTQVVNKLDVSNQKASSSNSHNISLNHIRHFFRVPLDNTFAQSSQSSQRVRSLRTMRSLRETQKLDSLCRSEPWPKDIACRSRLEIPNRADVALLVNQMTLQSLPKP